MARAGTFTIRIGDPDGVLDAIATLERIRDDADHRIAALRANLRTGSVEPQRYRNYGGGMVPDPAGPWAYAADEGRNVLPDATDDQAAVIETAALRTLGGTRGTRPPPPPPSDRG